MTVSALLNHSMPHYSAEQIVLRLDKVRLGQTPMILFSCIARWCCHFTRKYQVIKMHLNSGCRLVVVFAKNIRQHYLDVNLDNLEYLQQSPSPVGRILCPNKTKDVSDNRNICFHFAMGYRIFGKDQKVAEYDNIAHKQSQVRVLDIFDRRKR